MVQQGAFKVELVDAITKDPFIEHKRDDGSIYVEAEPKAEYLISIQKTRVSQSCAPHLVVHYYVDGKLLDSHDSFSKPLIEGNPRFRGPTDFFPDGRRVTHSLQFDVPPVLVTEESFDLGNFIQSMGQVKVLVYEGFPDGEGRVPQLLSQFQKSDAPLRVSEDCGDVKKIVLSARGKTQQTHRIGNVFPVFKCGRLLDTITLRYCCVRGLQLVGILSNTAVDNDWLVARRKAHREQVLAPNRKKRKIRYTEEIQNMGTDGLVREVNVVNLLESDSDDDDSNDDDSDQDDAST